MENPNIDTGLVVHVRDGKIEKARLIATHIDDLGVVVAVIAYLSDGRFAVVGVSELRLGASILPGPKPE